MVFGPPVNVYQMKYLNIFQIFEKRVVQCREYHHKAHVYLDTSIEKAKKEGEEATISICHSILVSDHLLYNQATEILVSTAAPRHCRGVDD